nr:hypothetical protein [Pseudomonas chlororaphis]
MNQFVTPSIDAPPLRVDHRIDQLLSQLERIDLMLQQRALQMLQEQDNHILEDFILSPEEIDARLLTPQGVPHWYTSSVKFAANIPTCEVSNCTLLDQLGRRFNLTEFEKDVLLLGLLPHFDQRYVTLFSALQQAQQKKTLILNWR